MKVALQSRNKSFSISWEKYMKGTQIDFIHVDAQDSNIIKKLKEVDLFLWHWSHGDATANLFARQLIKAVEESGVKVFPSFNECWHFDDKVAQKYLLEAINAPLVPSHVFYNKKRAFSWVHQVTFPKVFKLRGGAGSSNVKLIRNLSEACKFIEKSYTKGFSPLNKLENFKAAIKNFQFRNKNIISVGNAIGTLFFKSSFEKIKGREIGYSYFQDFMPANDFDTRIIIIGKKAIGIKRLVRPNDFRASGSGLVVYDQKSIDLRCVEIAFDVSSRLKFNCMGYDFIYNKEGNPLIIEIGYGFTAKAYYDCPGYWNQNLEWTEDNIKPEIMIIEHLIEQITFGK